MQVVLHVSAQGPRVELSGITKEPRAMRGYCCRHFHPYAYLESRETGMLL